MYIRNVYVQNEYVRFSREYGRRILNPQIFTPSYSYNNTITMNIM